MKPPLVPGQVSRLLSQPSMFLEGDGSRQRGRVWGRRAALAAPETPQPQCAGTLPAADRPAARPFAYACLSAGVSATRSPPLAFSTQPPWNCGAARRGLQRRGLLACGELALGLVSGLPSRARPAGPKQHPSPGLAVG